MPSTQLQISPQVGDTAPEFTAASTGSDVTLSAFRGKINVLMAFFPLAFTAAYGVLNEDRFYSNRA